MKITPVYTLSLLLSSLLTISTAFANVTIVGTRVIYPAGEKEVTVRLDNRGQMPSLVQAWIDDGDPNAAIDKINVPFILLPPVFRMEANKGQTLRMVYTGKDTPALRESVYWLNVLDIPPKDKSLADKNKLQMAIRSRIKIFYRPTTMNSEGAEKAAQGISWKPGGKAGELIAYNPSGYYVNIANAEVSTGSSAIKATTTHGDMVAPGENKTFTFKNASVLSPQGHLTYLFIDDFGATQKVEADMK